MEWCVAYGSLMDPQDASHTLGQGLIQIPALLKGFSRDWQLASSRRYACVGCGGLVWGQPTALDCHTDPAGQMPVVLVGLEEEQLAGLDSSEVVYARQKIDPAQISALAGDALPGGNFWLYQANAQRRIEDADGWHDLFVPDAYQQLVFSAARLWGERFLQGVKDSIQPAAWPIRGGMTFVHGKDHLPDCMCAPEAG